MEHYFNVFIEALWNASVIPLGHEPTLAAMQSFGGFNMPLAVTIAITGATTGMMLNWLIGVLILKSKPRSVGGWYEKASRLFNTYGIFLLLFTWAPMLKILPVVAGFLNVRFRTALLLIAIGQVVSYGRLLL